MACHTGLDKVIEPAKIVYKVNTPLIYNNTVKAIQTALKLKVDGYFGLDTDKAVKNFQKKIALDADGIVGKKTAIFLEALVPVDSLYKGLLTNIK